MRRSKPIRRRKAPLRRIRRNKYGVGLDEISRDLRTYKGTEYHSKMEARYAAALDLRMRAVHPSFRIAGWKRQVPVKLEVNGKLVSTYIVDFVVTHTDGRLEYVEIKGLETPEWKIKEKLFRALFPDRKLTIVRN